MNRSQDQDLNDRVSALAPLTKPAFASLWLATVLSNVGTWMNDVGAGWLMTTLSPSPFMVALVQAATTLPIFLFALPALGILISRFLERLPLRSRRWGLAFVFLLASQIVLSNVHAVQISRVFGEKHIQFLMGREWSLVDLW